MTKLPWISVKDQMPPIDQNVLFWSLGDGIEQTGQGYACHGYRSWYSKHNGVWIWYNLSDMSEDANPSIEYAVTHWMEITPPESE
jgi:hypothetical protein